jgi:type VI secretion system ImpC/EvpB family protein
MTSLREALRTGKRTIQPSRNSSNCGSPRPPRAAEAIVLWSQLTGLSLRGRSPTELSNLIGCAIGEIDILLTDQVNAIVHHPRYQKLEASWRGLQMLVEQAPPESRSVKIRVLNVSWKELCRDLDNAIEFDQSHLFRKVYEEEFGTPNGEPYGVLIGDYTIRNNYDDLDALEKISGVAAAAFAPFIASADPSLLDIDDFRDMERLPKLGDTLGQPQFTRWRSLRDSEDSRFVALTMPRMLMRRPLEYDGTRIDGFRFEERAVGPDAGRYLWGSASYALGAVIMRCFETTGWLADIRGVRRDEVSGGLVVGRTKELPPGSLGGTAPAVDRFSTDSRDIAVKPTTELIITDEQERELSELGFVPLCHCHGTSDAAFYSVHSIQKPKQYDDDLANANAKISSMLQYTLCASRFAHYLKVIIRDKIGSSLSAEEIQYTLNHWISDYIRAEDEAPMDVKGTISAA